MKLKDLNIEYLNCPFCGSDDIEIMYDDGYNVGCLDCSTYIAPFLGNDADSKQKHIDFWNTRAEIKSQAPDIIK